MFHIDDRVDQYGLPLILFHNAERLVQSEFPHAEFPVKLRYMALELLHIPGLLQLDGQVHNTVPDTLIKHPAALSRGPVGGELSPHPGRFKL